MLSPFASLRVNSAKHPGIWRINQLPSSLRDAQGRLFVAYGSSG